MTYFKYAPEVEEVAKGLIENLHIHLSEVQIRYLFRDKPQKVRGKECAATASVVSGRSAFLAQIRPGDNPDDFELVAEPMVDPYTNFSSLTCAKKPGDSSLTSRSSPWSITSCAIWDCGTATMA